MNHTHHVIIYIFLCAGLISTSGSCYSQNNPLDELISIPYSSSSLDALHATDIDESDLSIYVAGYVNSDEHFGNGTSSWQGGKDGVLAKYDAAGTLLWYVYIGGSGLDYISDIKVSDNGNVVVVGTINGVATFHSTNPSTSEVDVSGRKQEAFVASYNKNGLLNWVETYGGVQNDVGLQVSSINNNIFAVVAFDNENNDVTIDGHLPPPVQTSPEQGLGTTTSYALISLSKNGNLGWKSYLGSNRDDIDMTNQNVEKPWLMTNTGITVENERLFIAALYSKRQSLYDASNNRYFFPPGGNSVDDDIMFMEYDLSGTPLWQTSIWIDNTQHARYLRLTSDCNGLYISATLNGATTLYPNSINPYTTGTGYDAMVFKANLSNGNILWNRELVTADNDYTNDYIGGMSTDQNGNLFIFGGMHQKLDYNLEFPGDEGSISPVEDSDMFLGVLNTEDGKVKYMAPLGNSGPDYGRDIDVYGELISMAGVGRGEDEFVFPPGLPVGSTINLAQGIAINNMCPGTLPCAPTAIYYAGSISSVSSSELCPNEEIVLSVTGNTDIPTWHEVKDGSWQVLDTGVNTLNYTATANVELYTTVNNQCGIADTSAAFSITMDSTAPIAQCLGNYTSYLDGGGNASIDPSQLDNGSTDNCGTTFFLLSKNAFDCSDLGTLNVDLIVSDSIGNTSSCTVQVEVVDTISPLITCPLDQSINLLPGECTVQLTNIGPLLTSDNCSSYTISYSIAGASSSSGNDDASGSVFENGLSTVTYLIDDGVNQTECSFQVSASLYPPEISISDANAIENEGFLEFVVELSHPACQDITITYATSDVTAENPTDYSGTASSSLLISVGQITDTIFIPIVSDNQYEGDENMHLTLMSSDYGLLVTTLAAGTILDDDSLPELSTNNLSVNETSGTATLLINLSTPISQDVIFDLITYEGAATSTDYAHLLSAVTLTIPASASGTSFEIGIIDDALYEGDEDFRVELSNPSNASLSSQYIAEVWILDDEVALSVSAWADTTLECDLNQSLIGYNAIGGCLPYTVVRDSTFAASCGISGVWTYTFTVTDFCGTILSTTQQVTLVDSTSPVLTVPDNIILDCSSLVPSPNASVSDGCNSASWSYQDINIPIPNCEGSYILTRTYLATDDCDNTTEKVQILEFKDNTAPVLGIESDLEIQCGSTITHPAYITSDECGSVTVLTDSLFTPACGGTGTWTYTYTATDGCSNSTVSSAQAHIIDTSSPTLNIPNDLILSCNDIVPSTTAAVIDDCDTNTSWSVEESSETLCTGTSVLTRTYTASDACGNTSAAQQLISVVDDIPPSLVIDPDTTVTCESNYHRSIAIATDGCSSVTVTVDSVFSPTCGTSGAWTYTFTATDHCGNTAQAIQNVTRVDLTKPTLSIPSDTILGCGADIPTASATSMDNCGVSSWTSSDLNESGCGNSFTIYRTYTATDACNNSTSAIQDIVFQDIIAPQITLLEPSVSIECGTDYSHSIYEIIDNCGASSVAIDSAFTPSCGNTGIWIYTFTGTDECGNSSTVNQNIEIIDSSAPSFIINEDIIVECGSNPDVVGSSSWIDCNPMSMQLDTVFISNTGLPDSFEINYTLTDDCGNDSTQTQLLQFQDTSNPVANAQDISIPLNAAGHALVFAYLIDNESYDECSEISIAIDVDTLFSIGEYPVQLNAQDYSGNTSETSAVVSVFDNIPPEALCTDVTIYIDSDGLAPLSPNQVDQGSNDNSGTIIWSLSETLFDCSDVSSPSMDTLFVSDGTTISYCVSQITVMDTISPVLLCPDTLQYSMEDNGASVQIEIPIPDFTENCPGAILANDQTNTDNASGLYPFGYTSIIWTVGNNGLADQCETVIDIEAFVQPEILCENIIESAAAGDDCGAILDLDYPVTAGVTQLSNSIGFSGEPMYFPLGETEIAWSAITLEQEILTCTTLVNIVDTTPPTITCLSDTLHCGLSLALPIPFVSDNCITDVEYSIHGIVNAPLEFESKVPTEVVWLASDGANSAQCTTLVTAHDNSIMAIAGTDQDLDAIYETTIDALTQSDGVGYWTFIQGEGVISSNLSNVTTVSQLQSGTNILQWTVESEVCGSSVDELVLKVRDFLLPTAFSPNGDGYNDKYRIVGINSVPNNEFSVYNRWGKLVYSAQDYRNDWDGHSLTGSLVIPDTYYFIFEVNGESSDAYHGSLEIRY